ncbi:MAG: dihydropteroate synthase [Bdellovibrionales bacterium]|nr:dihydropteroate synthase [Bdellovibrionales bacterium]
MKAREKPLLMGIVNVTPDSFSDGGCYLEPERAILQAVRLAGSGADIVDIGGESTRPGAVPVSAQEEMDRVLPVIEGVVRRLNVRVSIDTQKLEVAREAAALGATILNDVSGGSDIRMALLAAERGLTVVLMHMQGTPQTMQQIPTYDRGVVSEVHDALAARVRAFEECGVGREKIWIDPGIGFGKTVSHNLELLAQLGKFSDLGARIVVGTSRKSFLARVLENPELPMAKRESATIATNLYAYTRGASVFRIHRVGGFRRALALWKACEACE